MVACRSTVCSAAVLRRTKPTTTQPQSANKQFRLLTMEIRNGKTFERRMIFFLNDRTGGSDGDAAWERIIANPKPRPKLRKLAEKICVEMKAGKHFPPMRAEDL